MDGEGGGDASGAPLSDGQFGDVPTVTQTDNVPPWTAQNSLGYLVSGVWGFANRARYRNRRYPDDRDPAYR